MTTTQRAAVLKDAGGGWVLASSKGMVGMCPMNYLGESKRTVGAQPLNTHVFVVRSWFVLLLQVLAIHDYTARNHDELSFCEGDVITGWNTYHPGELSFGTLLTQWIFTVVEADAPHGWGKGSRNGIEGLFPLNHVHWYVVTWIFFTWHRDVESDVKRAGWRK